MDASMTEEAIASSLAQDRPTIEAAIKSYMCMVAARSLTDGAPFNATNAQALSFARFLLQDINEYKFPPEPTTRVGGVVAKVWNGLIDSKQKPCRFLGRLALLHSWEGITRAMQDPEEPEGAMFVEEFGALLKQYKASPEPTQDSNAHLIWDEPGVELERRRQRRAMRAEEAKGREETFAETVTPIIEEVEEEPES